MSELLDKITCFFVGILGSREETYLGANIEGHHLFMVQKSLFGFTVYTGNDKKYERIINTQYGKIGIREIKQAAMFL